MARIKAFLNQIFLNVQSADASAVAGDNLFANRIGSTMENFASLFNGVIDGVSSSEDNLAGIFDFKIPGSKGLKFQTAINEPKLYGPIREAFGEERKAEADALESGLDELDADITLKLSYSLITNNLGRSARGLNEFLKPLATAATKKMQENPNQDGAPGELETFLGEVLDQGGDLAKPIYIGVFPAEIFQKISKSSTQMISHAPGPVSLRVSELCWSHPSEPRTLTR